MDNTSVIAYINKMDGTVSPALNKLNKEFWLWCMERDISVQAQHLAGKLNKTEDNESRVMKDNYILWYYAISIMKGSSKEGKLNFRKKIAQHFTLKNISRILIIRSKNDCNVRSRLQIC